MKELTVDARPESLSEIRAFVGAELEAMACPEDTMTQLFVVIDEVFANIASYAYGEGGGSATVRLEAETEPRSAVLTFLDSGIPFDPLTMKSPDTSLKARERKIGGLGIFMVRKLTDEVSYAYSDGKNILRTVKRF